MKFPMPTDENTEVSSQSEAKKLFFIHDPLGIYNVDGLEFILRTL